MAGKKKPDPARFAPQAGRRRSDTRPVRRYYLIVCEGAKTETNYFEGLKKQLPPGVLEKLEIHISGEGRNTRSLIDMALRRKEEIEADSQRVVDKIWVVFDRDSFGAELFNSAIHSCAREDVEIEAAWSNEAFELWYLLHFEFHQSALRRQQYKQKIEKHFREAGHKGFSYEKNHPDMFSLLGRERLDTAIRNAQSLMKIHSGTDHANHNPCTTVHRLVIEMLQME
jgi:hypothetical protein